MRRHCCNLRTLELPSHAATKPAYIASLPPSIQILKIHHASSFSEATLIKLSQTHLPHLHTLALVRSLIKNKELSYLPRNLVHLSLEGSFLISGADSSFTALPSSLRTLSLAWCSNLVPFSLAHLPQSITSLDLSNCSRLQGEALRSLPTSLRALDVSGSEISSESLAGLPNTLTHLTTSSFHDGTLPPQIKSLHLSKSPANLSALPQQLSTLSLTNMMTTDEELSFVPLSLRSLSIVNCPKLTSEGKLHYTTTLHYTTPHYTTPHFTTYTLLSAGVGKVIKGLQLERLCLASPLRNDGHMFRPAFMPGFNDDLLQFLPDTLRQLEVHGTLITKLGVRVLPTRILVRYNPLST